MPHMVYIWSSVVANQIEVRMNLLYKLSIVRRYRFCQFDDQLVIYQVEISIVL